MDGDAGQIEDTRDLFVHQPWNPDDTPNFTLAEMACKCGACGLKDEWPGTGIDRERKPGHAVARAAMDGRFMVWLQMIRRQVEFPFIVTSGYRCEEYNKRIRGGPAHPMGLAVDLGIWGIEAHMLVTAALSAGAQGVGVSQRGPIRDRFIHLDLLRFQGFPRPRIWSY